MSGIGTLLPDCVLPGCRQPVATIGEPCDGCRVAFGHMLQPTTRPALTSEQIHERDHGTRQAAAVMADIARQAPELEDVGEPGEQRLAECWQCEDTRLCEWSSMGWECRTCSRTP